MERINSVNSNNIYIEINGRKIAVVESYKAKSKRELTHIAEIGNKTPVATVFGKEIHSLELKRVFIIKENNIDFYGIENFDLVIVRPDKKILYENCNWESISEGVETGEPFFEVITLISNRRTVL